MNHRFMEIIAELLQCLHVMIEVYDDVFFSDMKLHTVMNDSIAAVFNNICFFSVKWSCIFFLAITSFSSTCFPTFFVLQRGKQRQN